MKKYVISAILALVFIIHPSVALGAPLTHNQAESLIAVVQSSPNTPASAFIELITVFSNITDKQAESLIGVVKASPNTPAGAFVSFLIAFTVDPIENPFLGGLNTKVTELTNQVKILTDKPAVDPVKEAKIAEIKSRILDLDQKMLNLSKEQASELAAYEALGGARTAYEVEVHNKYLRESTIQWNAIDNDRSQLYLELRRVQAW